MSAVWGLAKADTGDRLKNDGLPVLNQLLEN
jgi:hypothetical protein